MAGRGSVLLLACLGAVGCASTIDLDHAPAGEFDLNGAWRLIPELSSGGPPQGAERYGRGDALSFLAHDFPVVRATEMHIEQNDDSMGVEFRPGGYRDVSWGNRQRGRWEVDAGWDEAGNLVIYSRGRDLDVRETIFLDRQDLMTVVMDVDGDGRRLELTRVFERVQP